MPGGFELSLSKLIEIWRDVLAHYDGQPEVQQRLKRELLRAIESSLEAGP